MKIAPILVALVIAAAPAASAQTPESKQKPAPATKAASSDVEQTLMKMEHDALAALLKKDTAAFGRIFADDAVLITPDGTPQTKSQLLADVKSGDLVIESSEMSDMKVRAYGDAAVVTYMTNDKGKYKGQDIAGRYRWTDVFVRSGGTWHIVASQGTQIPPPPAKK
jgi:ketosteroid isomerase-like protein